MPTKPLTTKAKTAQPSAPARVRLPVPHVGGAEATERPAVVVATPSRGRGSDPRSSTTPGGADARTPGKSHPGEAGGLQTASVSTEGEVGGGPAAARGGRPKCGSRAATERASALATDTPDHNISSGDYIPSSEDTHTLSTDTPLLSINIHTVSDKPAYTIPPGNAETQPKLGKFTGRDHTGKIIPHQRDEGVARKIADWVAIGAGENEIAMYLNLRLGVLRKHYKRELTTGKFENDMAVGGKILEMAKSGEHERMTLLYAKARMGWRESDANDQNNAALLNIHIHT